MNNEDIDGATPEELDPRGYLGKMSDDEFDAFKTRLIELRQINQALSNGGCCGPSGCSCQKAAGSGADGFPGNLETK